MTSVVVIVEGYGELPAIPALVAKSALLLGTNHYSLPPIRAKEYPSLRRAGELERYLDLALTRQADKILIALDLDDDCPVTEYPVLLQRVGSWINGRQIDVGIVFFNCEYEGMFISQLDHLYGIIQPSIDPESIRGAKGFLERAAGINYKETRDQVALTKSLDLALLQSRSRSYRKFLKELI